MANYITNKELKNLLEENNYQYCMYTDEKDMKEIEEILDNGEFLYYKQVVCKPTMEVYNKKIFNVITCEAYHYGGKTYYISEITSKVRDLTYNTPFFYTYLSLLKSDPENEMEVVGSVLIKNEYVLFKNQHGHTKYKRVIEDEKGEKEMKHEENKLTLEEKDSGSDATFEFEKMQKSIKNVNSVMQGNDVGIEKKEENQLVLQHKELCNLLNETYAKKNKAYGNSFGDTFDKLGIISAATRISDKYNRFVNLATSKEQIDTFDESIKDTLLDMANYCIMTVMALNKGE